MQENLFLKREHRSELEMLAKALLEKEVIHKSDIERMIGPRPFQIKGTTVKDEETQTNPVEEPNGIPPIPSSIDTNPDMGEIGRIEE